MKYIHCLFMLLSIGSNAQSQTNQNFVMDGGRQFLLLDDMSSRVSDFVDKNRNLLKTEQVSGSIFITEQWNKGYVLLPDGRVANDLMLRLDAYTNSVHFYGIQRS